VGLRKRWQSAAQCALQATCSVLLPKVQQSYLHNNTTNRRYTIYYCNPKKLHVSATRDNNLKA